MCLCVCVNGSKKRRWKVEREEWVEFAVFLLYAKHVLRNNGMVKTKYYKLDKILEINISWVFKM